MDGGGVILEFDLGNSRSKWRMLEESRVVDRGVTDDVSSLALDHWPVSRIRVASVVSEALEQKLVTWAQRTLKITPEFARTSASCAGVKNVYAEPHRLGVDRWLAMLAAYSQCDAGVLVVDAGTAMTIDYVDRGGQHLGGYILPGLRLSEQALLRDTSRVLFSEPVVPSTTPGCSTGEAVRHGGYFAAIALLEKAVSQGRTLLGEDARALITGGDAELLQSLFAGGSHFDWQPDLVFDGLSIALP